MDDTDGTQHLMMLLEAGRPRSADDVDRDTVRYALYARKSTTSEDRQASSIEDQMKDCMERLIVPNNLNIVKVYQESYSAKVAGMRTEFNSMINEIENGHIDGLISWAPDRLSRNMKEAGEIIDLVDRGLIRDLQFSTFTFENTPAGKMLLGVTFVMAKQYSEHLAESVDRGNKRAIEDGEFIGEFKHGYVVGANRMFQPDSRNFTKVQHMFKMILEGKSQKDVRLWINEQGYTVQKRPGGEYVSHSWDKDDVSKLIRDPHYAGVHKWGKSLTNLIEQYDFEPMVSANEFLAINKIDSLDSSKVLTIYSPKTGGIKADLMRGRVFCGACSKPLTSMLIDKRDKNTGAIIQSRFYYKCETIDCSMEGKSIRGGSIVETAQRFFSEYLFITKNNYAEYTASAKKELAKKTKEFDRSISRLKKLMSDKEKSYEKTKDLLSNSPELKNHYDLDKYMKDIEKLKFEYTSAMTKRSEIINSMPSFQEYLKLLESTPDVLGKIRDMKTMDALLRIFFSNFTVTASAEGSFKGSTIGYKLNEPWEGFVRNGDFVLGAP